MTWAEYTLRLVAYNRKEENNLKKIRRLAWFTTLAPYQDVKKLNRLTEDKFWQIGKQKKVTISEDAKNRFLDASRVYWEKVKAKQNGGVKG